jgi:hypothetical protein
MTSVLLRMLAHENLRTEGTRRNAVFTNSGVIYLLADRDCSLMPQIWMTYREIAALLGCEPDEARIRVVQRSLDRKKSRDGLTRVKLDPHWMARFYAAIRNPDALIDQAVCDLQIVHTKMNRDDSGVSVGLTGRRVWLNQ